MKLKSTLLIILFVPITLFSQKFSDLSHLDCDSLFNLNGLSNQEIESKTNSLILTGEFEQALSWLNCLIKIDSNNPYFYSTRAAIRSAYFDDTLFISDYKKALIIDSNNLISNYNLGAEYYYLLDGDDSYSIEQKDTTVNKSCDFYFST